MCRIVCLMKIWKKSPDCQTFLVGNIKALGGFERQVVKENFSWQLDRGKRFVLLGKWKDCVKTKANRREDGLLALKVEELLARTWKREWHFDQWIQKSLDSFHCTCIKYLLV